MGGCSFVGRYVEPVCPARLQLGGADALELLPQPLRRGPLGAGKGKEPVHIGMLQPRRHLAGLAPAARFRRVGRLLTDEKLGEPEPHPLLPYSRRAV